MSVRDLTDAAATVISADRRFPAAYDAALNLATVPLRCSGYRTRGVAHHATVFEALPIAMAESMAGRADFFEACRIKRNVAHYQRSGMIQSGEVEELLAAAQQFLGEVRSWVSEHHPDLLP